MINKCRAQAVSSHFQRFFFIIQYAVGPEEIPVGHIAAKSQFNLTLPCGDRIFLYVYPAEVPDQSTLWEGSNSIGEAQAYIKRCSDF